MTANLYFAKIQTGAELKVSIIIPVRGYNQYLKECLAKIHCQSYPNYEIIIISDQAIGINDHDLSPDLQVIVPDQLLNPSAKRDLGVKASAGAIIAFIDDDAYPDPDWLKNALKLFEDNDIAAVGGPGLDPPEDSFWQKIGGKILAAKLASGSESYRNQKKPRRFVNDYPSFNFLIRRDIFMELGGFDYEYWRGEDTKLCLKIINWGGKILYDPEVIVYHHKRAFLAPHLQQLWKCSLYRGFFAKIDPKISGNFKFFVPSLFLLGLILGTIFLIFDLHGKILFLGIFTVYFLLLLFEIIKTKSFKDGLFLMIGIFLTHLTYGAGFITGLLSGTRQMKAKVYQ